MQPATVVPTHSKKEGLMKAELLTIDELSHILRVSRQRAYELCRNNVVPHVRLGRQIRIDPGQLQTWLADGGRGLPGGWRRDPAA
jgi:excisionase family DNA binding protein